MDGRGRLAQSLNRIGNAHSDSGSAVTAQRRPRRARRANARARRASAYSDRVGSVERALRRYFRTLGRFGFTRGGGIAASVVIIFGSIVYGAVKGDHVAPVISYLKDMRDMAANTAGFRITGIAFFGQQHLNREEILARAGVTGVTSLLFLDVADARSRLVADPRIADANILKLYPDRLQITITEREPFALWQNSGRVSVIAADGTVMEPYVSAPFAGLPFVVGRGAEKRAKDFLALLDRYPDIRDQVRASILIAERRWNLRLKNGMDVRLPDTDVEQALDRLVSLDRNQKIISRDITAIDLRLPDRVTVRLSDAAAQARDAMLKDKAKQKKGGSA